MDLKRIEKFLSAMMPQNPVAKDSVHIAFECMNAHPITAVPTIGMMIGKLQQRLYSLSEQEAAMACSNVLTGVMIAWASEHEDLRKYIIDDYLEQAAKMRGEHVIDLWQRKAER